ncbi:MAG TPA: dihydrofolate reductase family protein [Candidatus Angelobacter sp.]|nr:dihydrofolate reductase family protein [Candidatus Angelobacter sp.]
MKLPFVLINMAMTADGKIATANRAVSSFTSRRDFEHLLELRASADAVMSGARTVDQEGVNLGPGAERFRRLRLKNGLAECNLRIVASGSGSLNPRAAIFRHHFSPVVVLVSRRAPERNLRLLRALADEVKVFGGQEIDFRAAFMWLRDKWKIERLLCEGGGELNGSLFRDGLVNELHLTVCPKVFGGRQAPTIADGPPVLKLAAAARLALKSIKRSGDEVFLTYDVLKRVG